MRIALVLVLACQGEPAPLGATISISGTSYAVKSAVTSGTHIALSTGSMDCSEISQDADVIVSRGALGWTLGGKRFSQIHTAKTETMTGARLEVAGGAVTLGGNGTIGGNAIALAGRLPVVECPE